MKLFRIAIPLFLVLATTAGVAQSDAQKSFDKLKSLVGSWEGKGANGQPVQVAYRVTSGGSALMSEIMSEDSMVSMFHLDGDRLLLTHYCGAGNQPRMKATTSPDGKSIAFEFVDATNLASPSAGHMHQAVFTSIDTDHRTEDWVWVQDGKETRERFDLHRKN